MDCALMKIRGSSEIAAPSGLLDTSAQNPAMPLVVPDMQSDVAEVSTGVRTHDINEPLPALVSDRQEIKTTQ